MKLILKTSKLIINNSINIKIMTNISKKSQTKQHSKNGVVSSFSIPKTLELIREQTGLNLELCDYFTGIKKHNGKKFFNVILQDRISESKEYDTLKRFADKYKLISINPAGCRRVAIIQNDL